MIETMLLCTKKSLGSFEMLSTKCVYKSYIYLIYMYKDDLALDDLQWLICHKSKPNESYIYNVLLM